MFSSYSFSYYLLKQTRSSVFIAGIPDSSKPSMFQYR
nr:MAG TPA: hypothetical protein [Caudoviricetes sp.]